PARAERLRRSRDPATLENRRPRGGCHHHTRPASRPLAVRRGAAKRVSLSNTERERIGAHTGRCATQPTFGPDRNTVLPIFTSGVLGKGSSERSSGGVLGRW